jgi:hypothetical protein
MAKAKRGQTVCSLSDLLYQIELLDNPFYCNKESSIWVMGKLPYEPKPFFIQSCSDIYELVPNVQIFPEIEKILNDHGITYRVEYSHTQNVRFYANYIITDPRFGYTMVGTSDTIQPVIRVQHSYNGLTKYRIIVGYYRMICTNGLVIAVQEMQKYNLSITGKHTTSIIGSLETLKVLLTTFSTEVKQITTEIVAKYELLGGRAVMNVQDRLIEVLNENKIAMIDNQKFNTVQDITGRIMKEANNSGLGYRGKVNDWLVYNGINQYLNDDSLNIKSPEKRMEDDSKVFEFMLTH